MTTAEKTTYYPAPLIGSSMSKLRTSLQVFPMVQRYAGDLRQAAQAVSDHTDREDLRTMASMYSNNLDSEMRRAGRYDLTLLHYKKTVSFCI